MSVMELPPEFGHLVRRSTTIAERMAAGTAAKPRDLKLPRARLERWRRLVAGGDEEKFSRRLAYDGLDQDAALSTLATPSTAMLRLSSPWVRTLPELLLLGRVQDQVPESLVNPRHSLPFEDVLAPVVHMAAKRVTNRACVPLSRLSADAWLDLQRDLLAQLCDLCYATLEVEFAVHKAKHSSRVLSLPRLAATGTSRLYGSFVRESLEGGFNKVLREYPMLARLLSTVVDCWIRTTCEFLNRLATDWGAVELHLGSGQPLEAVARLNPSLSDRHNGGRAVMEVEFDSGLKVMYKPRPVGLEWAYGAFLGWFVNLRPSLDLRGMKVLDRGTHGWTEQVAAAPCTTAHDLAAFYYRSGMTLALIYALRGTDLHQENVIAQGPHPILVDLETLLHPPLPILRGSFGWPDAAEHAEGRVSDSVLMTGLLPTWLSVRDKQLMDVSALGAIGTMESSVYRVASTNTDTMALRRTIEKTSGFHFPLDGDVPEAASEHAGDVVAGFEEAYRLLLQHRDGMLGSTGIIHGFQGLESRVVFRATRAYALVLRRALMAQCLSDGADFSIELEVLARPLASTDGAGHLMPVYRAEVEQLAQLDVPYFTTATDGRHLQLSGHERTANFFDRSGYDSVRSRISELSEEDLVEQIDIIEAALYTRPTAESTVPDPGRVVPRISELTISAPYSPGHPSAAHVSHHLVVEAVSIAKELRRRASFGEDGSAAWIGPVRIPRVVRFRHSPLGFGLYEGSCGVALFLAALYSLTDDAEWRDLSVAALRPVLETLTDGSSIRATFSRQLIGGGDGIGGVVYALVRLGDLLCDPNLVTRAADLLRTLGSDTIQQDDKLDVLTGTAGLLLALLAVHEATRDPRSLELAVACGDHLVVRQEGTGDGGVGWRALDGKMLVGFAHGAAGIAYALLRLCQVTGEVRYRQAAQAAYRCERGVVSRQVGGWPDLRVAKSGDRRSFAVGWCHGAPGIGLGRVGGLGMIDDCVVRREIREAVGCSLEGGLRGVDHVCCGVFGHIEFLLTASYCLGRTDLRAAAQRSAEWAVERATGVGGYELFAGRPGRIYKPSFFQGMAGIGYGLLRLAEPCRLPCVLLWE